MIHEVYTYRIHSGSVISLVMIYDGFVTALCCSESSTAIPQGAGGGMSDDEDRRSLSEDEDGEIEDGAAVDAIGGEEGGADGASVDGELEPDRQEKLDAKAGTAEPMMQRAEELDHRASDMHNDGETYNDDDDESYGGAPVEVDEYEPVEYQVTTREPSALAQIYGDGASAGVELKPELARGLKLHGVHELVTWTCTDGVGMPPRWAFVRNKPLVSCVVLVCAPGVDHARLSTAAELTPNIKKLLGQGVPTWFDTPTATEGNVVKALLFSVPGQGGDGEPRRGGVARYAARANNADEKNADDAARDDAKGPYGGTDARDLLRRIGDGPFPPEHYLLSAADMAEMDYPIPTLVPTRDDDAAVRDDDAAVRDDDTAGDAPVGRKRRRDDAGHEGSTQLCALALPEGYVVTQPAGAGVARHPPLTMCAMDCEMCYVGVGANERLELTRCSVVGPDGSVIYDKLVKPAEPITNYNTAHSGITEEQMRGVTTTLEDVQRELLELVACETIVIGHSLENDLKRLRLIHARCVDTVALYPHQRGPPYRTKLAHLTERYLARKIQEGSHDSVADARATLELAMLKFVFGPGFGQRPAAGASLFETLAANGTACHAIGPQITMRECASSGVARSKTTASDEATAVTAAAWIAELDAKAKKTSSDEGDGDGKGFLVFAHLRGYHRHLEESNKRWAEHTGQARAAEEYASIRAEATNGAAADAGPANTKGDGETGEDGGVAIDPGDGYCDVEEGIAADAALMDLDERVRQLWDAMPTNGMLILCTGAGDTARARTLQERKWKRSRGLGPWGAWTDEAEEELRRLRERVSRGVVFAGVKQKST